MQVIDTPKKQAINWAKQLLERDHFCVLQTKATGVGNIDEVCHVGLIDSRGNAILNSLVKPTIPISAEATAIHKLKNSIVEDAPSFQPVFLDLLRAVGNRDIVIYNSEFTLRMIRQSLRPYGIEIEFPTRDSIGSRIFTNGGFIHCVILHYSQFVGEWNESMGSYRWQELPREDYALLGDCRAGGLFLLLIQRRSQFRD